MTSCNRLGETRLILIGAAVLLSLGMGIRQSFGLFLTPVTRDLALTAADFTLAVAVQNIVWGLSQAPIGAIADRFGLRATMMAGAAIYVIGLGVMAAAAVGSLGTFLVPLATQGLLAHQAWQIGVLFFLLLAIAMLPAGFWAGGADRLPGRAPAKTTMRAVLG